MPSSLLFIDSSCASSEGARTWIVCWARHLPVVSQSQAWHPSELYFVILQLEVCKLQSLNFLALCLLVVSSDCVRQWETLLGGWKVGWGDGSLHSCFCFCHHPSIRAAIYGPGIFQHTRHQPHGAISGVPATATQRLLLCMPWLVTLPSPVCSPNSRADSYFYIYQSLGYLSLPFLLLAL